MPERPATLLGNSRSLLCRLGLHSYGLAPVDPAAQKRIAKLGLWACDWWAGGPTFLRCRRCGARR